MTNLFILLLSFLFSFADQPKPQPEFRIYQYENLEDTEYGSFVVVLATSEDIARDLIATELHNFGLTYDPWLPLEVREVPQECGVVIHSESGDAQ